MCSASVSEQIRASGSNYRQGNNKDGLQLPIKAVSFSSVLHGYIKQRKEVSFISKEEKQKRVSASTPDLSPQALLASPGILAPGLSLRGRRDGLH